MSSQENSPTHVPHEHLHRDLDNFLNDLDRGREHIQNEQNMDNFGQTHEEYLSKNNDDDFLVDLTSPENPESDSEQHERDHLEHIPQDLLDDLFANPPVQHDNHRSAPAVPLDPSPIEDVQDFINEVLPEPIRHSPLTDDRRHIGKLFKFFLQQYQNLEDEIASAVNDTHDEVDAIIDRLNSASPPVVPEQNSPSEDSGRDEVGGLIGDGREVELQMPISDSLSSGLREASPDEHTFDRRGPLTIPDTTDAYSPPTDEAPTAPFAYDDDYEPVSPAHSHFDDLPPRPPTPPRGTAEEDVQPEAIDLGPPSHGL